MQDLNVAILSPPHHSAFTQVPPSLSCLAVITEHALTYWEGGIEVIFSLPITSPVSYVRSRVDAETLRPNISVYIVYDH